ncbi:hypothetical protein L0222_08990 [bacterium]|nr:hypothetical protein [bacterium]
MDVINKFLGIQQNIISEPQDTEVPPEQTPQQVSSGGIASAPDAFETFQAPAFDIPSLATPMSPITSLPQSETFDPSSFFDLLAANPGGTIPKESVLPESVVAQDGPPVQEVPKSYAVGPEEAAKEILNAFKDQFGNFAADENGFHSVMEAIYGTNYSREKAEDLRQKALAGDYSWLPKIEFVPGNQIKGANGMYVHRSYQETVYLNDRLLRDPIEAAKAFIRGVGFHLDGLTDDDVTVARKIASTVSNNPSYMTDEANGNEGELFRAALAGEPTDWDTQKREEFHVYSNYYGYGDRL